jgi:ribosomal protein S27AE
VRSARSERTSFDFQTRRDVDHMGRDSVKCPRCGAASAPRNATDQWECFSCGFKFSTNKDRSTPKEELNYICQGCRNLINESENPQMKCSACGRSLCMTCFRPHETTLGFPRRSEMCWECYMDTSGVTKRCEEEKTKPLVKYIGFAVAAVFLIIIFTLIVKYS